MPWIFEPVYPSSFSLTGGLYFLKTFLPKTAKLMSVLIQMQDYAAGDLPLLKKSVNKINEVRIFDLSNITYWFIAFFSVIQ